LSQANHLKTWKNHNKECIVPQANIDLFWCERMQRKERIIQILNEKFLPLNLIVKDESHMHRREGIETHFYVLLVSAHFENCSRIERHRQVQSLLKKEFETGLHALSLYLYTPEEYTNKESDPQSPRCQHHRE
jgi:BolA family transcriptional regulator, general stress-responsive regulator